MIVSKLDTTAVSTEFYFYEKTDYWISNFNMQLCERLAGRSTGSRRKKLRLICESWELTRSRKGWERNIRKLQKEGPARVASSSWERVQPLEHWGRAGEEKGGEQRDRMLEGVWPGRALSATLRNSVRNLRALVSRWLNAFINDTLRKYRGLYCTVWGLLLCPHCL